MQKTELQKKTKGHRGKSSRKHEPPLHVDMPFDEFLARIVRVKPEKETKKAGK